LNDLQQRVQQESSICGTSSLLKQFLTSSGTRLRSLPHRYLRHGFIALSIPAALLAGTILPAAQQSSLNITPVAAAYGVQGSLSAFYGDGSVAEEATADDFIFTDTGMALGAPVNTRYAPISVDIANLRSGPGINYDRIAKLQQGQTVRLLGKNGDWYQIETKGGQTGWLHGELVDVNEAASTSLMTVKASAAPAKARVGTTTDSNVNLRSGPSTEYKIVTRLPAGIKLEVLGQQDGWYRVSTPKGTTGWITDDFFRLGQPTVAPAKAESNGAIVARVGESRVNLRKGPNTRFGSYGRMAEGTEIQVLARNGNWLKVRSPRGTIGWIAKDLVEFTSGGIESVPITKDVPVLPKPVVKPAPAAPAAPAAPTGSASHDAAGIALRYVGARYVYGGASPRGFDCSGLTMYVYRQLGVNLPHKASLQFSTRYGQRVGFSNLAPGDLVFFANTAGPGITHVSLYVGNGMMVSANTPRTGVQYVSIHSRYWRSHFAGAIRPYR
jgi:cell wall-associated NlpC family hydrolase